MRENFPVLTVIVVMALFVSGLLAQSQRGGPGDREETASLLVGALDSDRNGIISAAEMARAAGALKKLDRDGDGKLTRDEFVGPRRPATSQIRVPMIPSKPLAKSAGEEKILRVLDDMDKNQRRGMMNVPLEDGRLLRILAETIAARRIVEIGTSNGFSGIWFCLALRKTGGKLITHELNERRAALARQNFKRAGVEDMITLVEGNAHETIKELKGPIDLLFIDADKPGYPDYLEKLLPLVRAGGLIIGHNMHRPAPSPDYIKAITTNPDLETVFLNMHAAGVGLTVKKR